MPLGLNATFYDTTNGAAGIHPAALTNAGYVTTWTTASGGRSGAALDWAQGAATWALGVSDAPHYEGLNALTLGAGGQAGAAAGCRAARCKPRHPKACPNQRLLDCPCCACRRRIVLRS